MNYVCKHKVHHSKIGNSCTTTHMYDKENKGEIKLHVCAVYATIKLWDTLQQKEINEKVYFDLLELMYRV